MRKPTGRPLQPAAPPAYPTLALMLWGSLCHPRRAGDQPLHPIYAPTVLEAAWIFVTASVGMYALAAAMQGYLIPAAPLL